MTLDEIISAADSRRTDLLVYTPTQTDLPEQLSTWNVSVQHRHLAPADAEPFVVLRDDADVRGTATLADFQRLLTPPDRSREGVESDPLRQAVLEMLDDTVFSSMSRRELLATTREFEDRAERTGRGRLAVGFQRFSAYSAQERLYRRLAAETDLDIEVYFDLADDPIADPIPGLTIRGEPDDVVRKYWFLLFDGDGDPDRKWALVAREESGGTYRGVWTYEPDLVDMGFRALEASARSQ